MDDCLACCVCVELPSQQTNRSFISQSQVPMGTPSQVFSVPVVEALPSSRGNVECIVATRATVPTAITAAAVDKTRDVVDVSSTVAAAGNPLLRVPTLVGIDAAVSEVVGNVQVMDRPVEGEVAAITATSTSTSGAGIPLGVTAVIPSVTTNHGTSNSSSGKGVKNGADKKKRKAMDILQEEQEMVESSAHLSPVSQQKQKSEPCAAVNVNKRPNTNAAKTAPFRVSAVLDVADCVTPVASVAQVPKVLKLAGVAGDKDIREAEDEGQGWIEVNTNIISSIALTSNVISPHSPIISPPLALPRIEKLQPVDERSLLTEKLDESVDAEEDVLLAPADTVEKSLIRKNMIVLIQSRDSMASAAGEGCVLSGASGGGTRVDPHGWLGAGYEGAPACTSISTSSAPSSSTDSRRPRGLDVRTFRKNSIRKNVDITRHGGISKSEMQKVFPKESERETQVCCTVHMHSMSMYILYIVYVCIANSV